jgi:SAM-dependent methyltransferase
MLLQATLGLKEDIYLIESSFEGLEMNLRTLDYLDKLCLLPEGSIAAAIVVRDTGGITIGASFKNKHPEGDFWFLIPYPAAKAARAQTEKLIDTIVNGEIVSSVKKKKVDAGVFQSAIREYLSASMAEGALCECGHEREPRSFAFNAVRNKQISSLLKKLAKEHGLQYKEMEALEICCGNGMSTAAIKLLFQRVLSIDNDRCAVCDGLYHGTLEPSEVMVVDAMGLSKYTCEKFDAVLGFMLGTIYEFNKGIWRSIFQETLKALKDGGFLLMTVREKEEVDFLAEAFRSMGVDGSVIDNRNARNIYDGWAFFAIKK